MTATVIRVAEPDRPAFVLRKGEEGISVFRPGATEPPLTESEILDSFRPGSLVVSRTVAEIEQKGMLVVPVPGTERLPYRPREAHAEIQPGPGLTRKQFKQALKELE
jgi:hypothetical protein